MLRIDVGERDLGEKFCENGVLGRKDMGLGEVVPWSR
jgi:hypothetical protein